MAKIKDKIKGVPEELCRSGCPHLWEGECRAYQIARSRREITQRFGGRPKCAEKVKQRRRKR